MNDLNKLKKLDNIHIQQRVYDILAALQQGKESEAMALCQDTLKLLEAHRQEIINWKEVLFTIANRIV